MSDEMRPRICGAWSDSKQGCMRLSVADNAGGRVDMDVPWTPFVWTDSEPAPIEGVSWKTEKLLGQAPLNRCIHFESAKDYEAYMKQRDKSLALEQVRPVEQQFLLQKGWRFFEGMRFEEVRRCQIDIETHTAETDRFSDASNPEDRVLAIGLRQGAEVTCLVLESMSDESERDLLMAFNEKIQALDPDIVEGHNIFKFDLDYLKKRCKLLKVPCAWGRFGQKAAFRNTRIRIAERWIDFPRCDIPGRTVFDTYLMVQLFDVTTRDLQSYTLKNIAIYFGVTDPDKDERSYIAGDDIHRVFVEDRERFISYLKDDLRETEGVADVLLPTYLAQIQNFPMTLQEATLRGTASKVDLVFLEKYYHARQGLPFPPEVQGFEGGYTRSFETGVFEHVLHFDVASLYPSLLMLIERNPANDQLGVFMPMLKELREYRLKYKELARDSEEPSLKREYHARQASFKILINSFYGYLGFAGARFADSDLAAEVTAQGRSLLQQLIEAFQKQGSQVLEADTDGIYLSPKTVAEFETPETLLAKVSADLPKGIELEIDGHYRSMFCYKAKNYALYDGSKVYIRGSALRSRGIEPFLKELTDCLIGHLLGAVEQAPETLSSTLRDQILQSTLPVERLAKREYLSQNPEKYREAVAAGGKSRRASLEVALRQKPMARMGEQVAYYITMGDKKRMPDWQVARPLAGFDPQAQPYDPQYYIRKLDDWEKRYQSFLDKDEGIEQTELF